jgi:hypothetical protein
MPLRVGTVGFIIDPSTITGCGGEKENLFVLCIGRRGVGKGGKMPSWRRGMPHTCGVSRSFLTPSIKSRLWKNSGHGQNVRLREAEPSRMDQTEVWSMTWMGQKPERGV